MIDSIEKNYDEKQENRKRSIWEVESNPLQPYDVAFKTTVALPQKDTLRWKRSNVHGVSRVFSTYVSIKINPH
jgi:hypothetical protein